MPDAEAGLAAFDQLRRRFYFSCRALLATPPPADFTHTDVPAIVVVPRNAQLPPLTGVVAMRAPVQAPPAAVPSWISTLAAPPATSTRSSKAPSRATSRLGSPRNLNWSSISRRRRRSA